MPRADVRAGEGRERGEGGRESWTMGWGFYDNDRFKRLNVPAHQATRVQAFHRVPNAERGAVTPAAADAIGPILSRIGWSEHKFSLRGF